MAATITTATVAVIAVTVMTVPVTDACHDTSVPIVVVSEVFCFT